jgi:hypothetical protein
MTLEVAADLAIGRDLAASMSAARGI